MPRSNEDEFFETREDWSRRKHLILEHYLPPATAKLRAASPDQRVVILDGFAGKGRYDDGSPGSPVQMGILANQVRAWQKPVDIRIHNVEADLGNHTNLEKCTDYWVQRGIVTNYNTTFREALPTILSAAGLSSLIAFLDPFRPTDLPLSDIEPLLTRQGKTEVFIIFHTPLVLRMISAVRPSAKTAEKTKISLARRLDAIFGGSIWQQFYEEEPTQSAIVACFMEALYRKCKECGSIGERLFIAAQPIQARLNVGLKYHVIFVTRHPDAVRLINDAYVKERGDVSQQAVMKSVKGTLFEKCADEWVGGQEAAAQRFLNVQNALISVAQITPGIMQTFEELLVSTMLKFFGQYTETEYTRATRVFLEATSGPRLIGISGNKLIKTGKWKVDDELRVQFAL